MRMVAKDDHLFWINHRDFTDWKKRMPTKCAYENIVNLYAGCGDIFGHFLQDSLPGILFIPKEIINKSMILVPFKNAWIWLQYFDIKPSQILYDNKAWFYADNLYMYCSTEPMNAMNVYSFKKLSNYLREKLNVTHIKGTRYVFCNKKKNERRSISNFADLIKITKENIPEYNWERDDWEINDIPSLSKSIASTKMLIAPSGSKLMNILFMNQDLSCGICIITTRSVDYPNFAIGISFNIWMIGFATDIGHYTPNQECNIFYGLTSIKRLIYALEKQAWPDETFKDMRFVFDLKNITERLKNDPTKMFEIEKGCCYEKEISQFLHENTNFE